MKKWIIIIGIISIIIPYIIILNYDKTVIIEYKIKNLDNISIEYNKNIIDCKEIKNNNTLKLIVTPKKSGKTKIIIKEHNSLKENTTLYKKKIYVHKSKIITKDNFFGECNGDTSFIICHLIILIFILVYTIINFIKNIRKNIYDYKNIKMLGLILFIFIIFIFNTIILITDLKYNYHSSFYIFLANIQNNLYIFIILMLPIILINSLFISIASIKLLIKESKTWKNILGIILAGFIITATVASIILYEIMYPTKEINILFIITNILSYIISIVVTYLECILISTIILSIITAKKTPKLNKDYIIILGCKIKNDGSLYPLLKARVDKAIEFANIQKQKTGKEIIYIPSGGKGEDEIISEAQAMKNYLIEQGIKEKNIIIEDKSKNTYENIKNSYNIIYKKNKNAEILFCTTNYHVFRTGYIASTQKIYIEGIGAKTKTYYWINAFIREFIATIVLERKNHIKIFIILSILSIFLFIMSYLSYYL